jgi:hypothetical protein
MNFWERGQEQSSSKKAQPNGNDKKAQQSAPRQGQSSNAKTNFDVMGEIARLNNLSETERMGELMRTANKMRSDGTLNGGDLERIYQTASMFMTEEQLQKLRALIEMVK